MRVLVDALSARFGGSLTYATNQLGALARVRPDWDLEVLAEPRNHDSLAAVPGIEVHRVGVPRLGSRLIFEQAVLPRRTARGADVLYCLGNFVPLRCRVPRVVVQQNARLFGVGRRQEKGIRHRAEVALAAASVRRAEGVIVISEALRAEMAEDGLVSDRCEVVPSGRPEPFGMTTRPKGLAGVERFFLSVASDYPYKRLDDLVRAWGVSLDDGSSSLVLAGHISPERVRAQRELVRPERRSMLIHLGHVSDRAQLGWLLEHAMALVATSELEAFPLTPSEAGAAGCPVVLSDIRAHREVSLDEDRFFPPGDVGALAEQLAGIAQDPPDRVQRIWPVTWDMNAERVAVVLERVVRR